MLDQSHSGRYHFKTHVWYMFNIFIHHYAKLVHRLYKILYGNCISGLIFSRCQSDCLQCCLGCLQNIHTGDPLHSRALAHSRALLFTQPCPHCSHSRAPGEQWARLCVFTLQGCVQAARLCRGSPVIHLHSVDETIQDGDREISFALNKTIAYIRYLKIWYISVIQFLTNFGCVPYGEMRYINQIGF